MPQIDSYIVHPHTQFIICLSVLYLYNVKKGTPILTWIVKSDQKQLETAYTASNNQQESIPFLNVIAKFLEYLDKKIGNKFLKM